MRLLFVQAGPRVAYDDEGNIYTDSSEKPSLWQERYGKYCDELRIMLRTDSKIYTKSEALAKFNKFEGCRVVVVGVPDVYRPYSHLFSLSVRREARRIIEEEVRNADRIIVRTPGFWQTNTVLEMCRKYGKTYLIESVDIPYLLCKYSGNLLKKMAAPFVDMRCRREIALAPYIMYVTSRELQKRYPTKGKSIGCSNVELGALNDSVLESRIKHIHESGDKIIFGTAASISSVKGQEHVIRAVAKLKAKGITNIEYRFAGSGSAEKFVKLAESLGVSEQVKFCGMLPRDEIFAWYDSLDVYIQPSFQEGLCRAIIEAMSRALPVTCSHVGGNPELVTPDMIFHAGNVKQIAAKMGMMLDPAIREREARKSFTKAHDYDKKILDKRRSEFHADFMGVKK